MIKKNVKNWNPIVIYEISLYALDKLDYFRT